MRWFLDFHNFHYHLHLQKFLSFFERTLSSYDFHEIQWKFMKNMTHSLIY